MLRGWTVMFLIFRRRYQSTSRVFREMNSKTVYSSIASFRTTIHSGILIHSTHQHIIYLSSHWLASLRKLHYRHLICSRQCHSPSLLSPYANRFVTAEQGKRADITTWRRLAACVLDFSTFFLPLFYYIGLRQVLFRCDNGTARQQENIFWEPVRSGESYRSADERRWCSR